MADEETVEQAQGEAAPASEPPADAPDSRRVRLVRITHEDGPATCISYDDGSGSMQQWHPDAEKDKFEVRAVIADAAVKSGFFIEAPTTKTRLRTVGGRKAAEVIKES
jgi:hypothetical protein